MSKRQGYRRWTSEEEDRLVEMYRHDTPARVIGKLLGRSSVSVTRKAGEMGLQDVRRLQVSREHALEMLATDTDAAYRAGYRGRKAGKRLKAPAHLSPATQSWWKAGWHDADMEMGNSVIKGAA